MAAITYNQSLDQAKVSLQDQLAKMRAEPDRTQLKVRDIDADTAYELGYEAALMDLDLYTGDDPVTIELHAVSFTDAPAMVVEK